MNKSKQYYQISSNVNLEVFEFGHSKRQQAMNPQDAVMLKNTLGRMDILEDPISYINYIPIKRSFIVSTTTNRHFHMRLILGKGFSWIYEYRRRIGMPQCCAYAHATGQGLPSPELKRANQRTYGIFEAADIIPCQRCMIQYGSDPYQYINHMVAHSTIGITGQDVRNSNVIAQRTIISLLTNPQTSPNLELRGDFSAGLGDLHQLQSSIYTICTQVREKIEQLIDTTNKGAEEEWEGDGILPNNLICNTSVRSQLAVVKTIEEAASKLNGPDITYDEAFMVMEYASLVRRNVQSVEFTYKLAG